MSGKRSTREVRVEVTIDAPIEEVWQAFATGEGLRRWFPFDARVDARTGGEIWLSWGPGMEGAGPLALVEPGRRMRWVEPRGEEDGQPVELAVEFELESRGASTLVRVVNSGFGTAASWDGEYDSISRGWAVYMRQLAWTFARHRGADRRVAYADVKVDLPVEEAWSRVFSPALFAREGSLANAREGGRIDLVTADGDRLRGEIQVWNPPKDLAITIADWNDAHLWAEIYPSPRARMVKLTLSAYGPAESEVRAIEARWRDALARAFADVART